jgi:two-component system sensor histidine kinase EvgS
VDIIESKKAEETLRMNTERSKAILQTAKEGSAQPCRPGSITILLVEDELNVLKFVKTILELEGYIVIAATPIKAIDLVKEHGDRIHLIIIDVVMPEMNGRELLNKILPLCPTLKYLFMTAHADSAIAHHGVLDEEVHLIRKPFSRKDFLMKVAETMEGA